MVLNRLNGASSRRAKDAFFSNYFAALLFLRLGDSQGLSLISDPHATALDAFSSDMSDLRFWGKVLFYPDDPEVETRMLRGHAKLLAGEAGRVMDSRIEATMRITQADFKSVEWSDVTQSLIILRERYEMYGNKHFTRIAYAISNWDSISDKRKASAISDCVQYLATNDSASALLPRLRELAPSSIIGDLIGALTDIVRSRA